MNTHDTYTEYKKELSEDAGKALAFFFLGIPAAFIIIALFFAFPFRMSCIALAAAGIVHVIKKRKNRTA